MSSLNSTVWNNANSVGAYGGGTSSGTGNTCAGGEGASPDVQAGMATPLQVSYGGPSLATVRSTNKVSVVDSSRPDSKLNGGSWTVQASN